MSKAISEKDYPVQKLWILKMLLISILGSAVLGFFLLSEKNDGMALPSFIATFIIIFPVFFGLISGILRRANFHYSLENKFLTIKQGVISKHQKHTPYGVIQNIIVKQDLFDRLLRLTSLIIENASHGGGYQQVKNRQKHQVETIGFHGNRITVPGLTKQDAESLKKIILQKMKENPIEDGQSGL